jgi:hypothetical protein
METRLIALALALVVLPASLASAQSNKLGSAEGKQVFVIDQDHREWQGRLLEATKTSIAIESSDGVRRFVLDEVVRVDADGDGVRDGLVKGAVFGAVVAAIFGARYAGPQVILQGAFAYGLVGVTLDALNHSKQTVYRGAAPQLSYSVKW